MRGRQAREALFAPAWEPGKHDPAVLWLLDPCQTPAEDILAACLDLGKVMAQLSDSVLVERLGLRIWEAASAGRDEEYHAFLLAKQESDRLSMAHEALLGELGPGSVRSWEVIGPLLLQQDMSERDIRKALVEGQYEWDRASKVK